MPKKEINKTKSKNKDRSMLILLIIIFILGSYLRLHEYGAGGGMKVDSGMFLAGSVLWYVPHDYFPGKFQMYAPLAHILVGKSCTASGADFSGASQLQPNFLVNIPTLIGKAFVESEMYCLAPIYISSMLTFIGLILLGILMLEKKPAIYHATIYAFLPILLFLGRFLYVDIFVMMFVTYSLIFLWLGYRQKKTTHKETIYFILAFATIGLAFATKLTAGMYIILSTFIIIEKYKTEITAKFKTHINKNKLTSKKDDLKHINQNFLPFLKLIMLSIFSFIITSLIPFELNPKNLLEIYQMHNTWHANDAAFAISLKGLKILYDGLFRISPLDTFIYIFSFYILARIIRKKQKELNEKFITYLCAFGFIAVTISSALGTHIDRRELPFLIGFPLLMSLAFSNNEYSIINYLNKKGFTKKQTNVTFISFISLSALIAIATLTSISPYYLIYSNPIMCKINNNPLYCTHDYAPIWKPTAMALKDILQDNETFYDVENPIDTYMYIRHEDGYAIWYMKQLYLQQTGNDITLEELKKIFEYQGRKIRYLMIHKEPEKDSTYYFITSKYTPIKIVYIKGHPVSYIYDLNEIYKE